MNVKTERIISVKVQVIVIQSSPTICDPMDYSLPGSSVHGDSPGKNTGVGSHALLSFIYINVCVYIYTHTHTHTHIRIYVNTHTHNSQFTTSI